jgi:hypothetical protein
MQMAPQPMMMAPQPMMMAPQQQVAQSPLAAAVLTTVLTNPGLIGRILGGIGELLSEFKQPRVRMAQSPMPQMQMAPAPIASAPAPGYGIPPGYQLVPAYPAYAAEDYGHDHGRGKVCRLCGPRRSQDYGGGYGPEETYQPPVYQQPPPRYEGPSPSPQAGSGGHGWFKRH